MSSQKRLYSLLRSRLWSASGPTGTAQLPPANSVAAVPDGQPDPLHWNAPTLSARNLKGQPMTDPAMVAAAKQWGTAALLQGSTKIPAYGPGGKQPKTDGWQNLTASVPPDDPAWATATGHGIVLTSVPHVLVVDVDNPQKLADQHDLLTALQRQPGLSYRTRQGRHHYYWTEDTTEIPWGAYPQHGLEIGRNTPRFLAGPGSRGKTEWPPDLTIVAQPPAELLALLRQGPPKGKHGGKREGAGRPPTGIGGYTPGDALGPGERYDTLLRVAAGLRGSPRYGETKQRSVEYLCENVLPHCAPPHDYTEKWCVRLIDDTWDTYPPPARKGGGKGPIAYNQLIADCQKRIDLMPGGMLPRPYNGNIYVWNTSTGTWTPSAEKTHPAVEKSVMAVVVEESTGRLLPKHSLDYQGWVLRQHTPLTPGGGEYVGLRNQDFHAPTGEIYRPGDPTREIIRRHPGQYNTKSPEGMAAEMMSSAFYPADAEYLYNHLGRRVLGYPIHDEHPIIIGRPQTGKSSLADLLANTIGRDLVTWHSPTALASRSRFARGGLDRAVLNISTEADIDDDDTPGDKQTLKAVLTGDTIPYERKHRDPTEITPQAGHIFIGNNSAVYRFGNDDVAAGLRRRFRIIRIRDSHEPYPDKPQNRRRLRAQSEIDWLTTTILTIAIAWETREELPPGSPDSQNLTRIYRQTPLDDKPPPEEHWAD